MKTIINDIENRFKSLREQLAKGFITQGEFDAKVNDLHEEVKAIDHPELTELDLAVERMELAKLAQSQARKELVALLPEATQEHLNVIVKATADGAVIPAGYRPGVDVRLTDTQRAAVKAAADARSKWLTKNRAVVMNEVEEQAGDLTGYTIRVGSQATTTKLTFTKSHGTKPAAGKGAGAALVVQFASIASKGAWPASPRSEG